MDQYCTAGDVERIIPEVQADAELEQVESGVMLQYIEEGTLVLKTLLRNRYDLAQFTSPPEGLPRMVRTFCALITASIVMKARQLGDNDRLSDIDSRKRFYMTLTAEGSLIDDAGDLLDTQNGPATDPAPIPAELVPSYTDTIRRGVPDMLPQVPVGSSAND